MKFLLNACLDTLPTKTNLYSGGKLPQTCAKDLQGRKKETTHHILKVSLNQQRYTWHHDNILRYICENVDNEKYQLNADIEGYSLPGARGDNFPRPLCYPWATRPRKAEKYSHFIPDITSANVKVIQFEIGSRGYISLDNKTSLKLLFKYGSKETTYRTFMHIYTKKIPRMGPPPTSKPQSVLSPLLMWPWPWPCPWPSTAHRYRKSTPANHPIKPKSCFVYCEIQSDLFIYALSGHKHCNFLFLFYWQI